MLQFMIFILFGYFAGGMFLLSNRFIGIAFGRDLMFSNSIVAILCLNFYFVGRRQIILLYRNAMGLFEKDQVKAVVEVIINIAASIILGELYGVIGIFIGTTISTIATSLWVEPYILFRYGLKEKWGIRFTSYMLRFVFDLLVVVVIIIISGKAIKIVPCGGIIGFFVSGEYTRLFIL